MESDDTDVNSDCDDNLLSPSIHSYKIPKRAVLLPPSSTDLQFSPQWAFEAAIVHTTLRRFSNHLRLSPFRFEDFCASLVAAQECSSLLNEVFVSLLRLLIREDFSAGTSYCGRPSSIDGRESFNLLYHSLDTVTWPAICRLYVNAQPQYDDLVEALNVVNSSEFPYSSGEQRLLILRCLLDMLLLTQVARDELNNDINPPKVKLEDCCRRCQQGGDLVGCAGCNAMFCLHCTELPAIPEEPLICPVCAMHDLPGINTVGDKYVNTLHGGNMLRYHLLGIDKQNRHYWFVARRLFVEESKQFKNDYVPRGVGCTAYYSSIEHIRYIMEGLVRNRNQNDQELYQSVTNWYQVMAEDTAITQQLTEEELKQTGLFGQLKLALNIDLEILRRFENNEDEPLQIDGSMLFRLGDGGYFRRYENQYVVNGNLALTLKQQAADNEKRKTLANKFCVLPPHSQFDVQWHLTPSLPMGEITWTPAFLADALRLALLSLESAIPRSNAFFMPAWLSSSLSCRWRRAVEICSTPEHFALALLILESNIRLVSFLPVWYETGGLIRLNRLTQYDREQAKLLIKCERSAIWKAARREARERRRAAIANQSTVDLEMSQAGEENDSGSDSDSESESESIEETTVKFSKKVPHSLSKFPGEEYRLQVGGGWFWMRAGHRPSQPSRRKCNLSSAGAKFRGQFRQSSVLQFNPVNDDDVVNVSDGLINRHLFAAVPGTRCPMLDSLLDRRIAMNGPTNEQHVALQQIIEPLQQGRSLTELFPPSLLPLPDNLPPCIRHLHITYETTLEQLLELNLQLMPPSSYPVKLISSIAKQVTTTAPASGIHRFQARSGSLPNVFVLPRHLTKWLSRRGGFVEICPGFFNQTSSMFREKTNAGQAWYGCIAPRPSFKTAWEYRTSLLICRSTGSSFPAVALQVRALAACLRFDAMYEAPPNFPLNICYFSDTVDGETITRELLKGRLHSKEQRRFEYFARIVQTNREGATTTTEAWVPDSFLQLWEVRYFHERLSRDTLKEMYQGKRTSAYLDDAPKQPSSSNTSPSKAVMKIPSPSKNPNEPQEQQLELTQSPAGNLQVKGLGSKQFLIRQPDGGFQLITLTSSETVQRERTFTSPQPGFSGLRSPAHQSSSLKQALGEKTASLKKLIEDKRRSIEKSFTPEKNPASHQTVPAMPPKVRPLLMSPAQGKPQLQSPVQMKQPQQPVASQVVTDIVLPVAQNTVEPSPQPSKAGRKRKQVPTSEISPTVQSKTRRAKTPTETRGSQPAPVLPDAPENVAVIEHPPPVAQASVDDLELYCICRTPYDPTKFYIACDKCESWFHGDCIGVSELAAQSLEVYHCDKCKPRQKKLLKVEPPVLSSPAPPVIPEIVHTSAKRGKKGMECPSDVIEKPATPVHSSTKTPRRVKAPKVSPLVEPEPLVEASKLEHVAGAAKSRKSTKGKAKNSEPETLEATKPTESTVKPEEELYCICRTPYDDALFYICCDKCEGWYHGSCVFVAECEAKWIVSWVCSLCKQDDTDRVKSLTENPELWSLVQNLLNDLVKHKKSWPFREPVNKDLYPVYYQVIRSPIDLSTIAARISQKYYVSLDQFKYDVLLMFDNCRRFNPPESTFFKCADDLQNVFMEKYRVGLAEKGIVDSRTSKSSRR